IHLLGLCKTHRKVNGQRRLHNDYHVVFKGRDDDAIYGVAIILEPPLAKRIEHVVYISDRIIGLVLKVKHCKIGVIQVYAAQQGRPSHETAAFFDQLQSTVDKLPNYDKTVILGDMNTHVGTSRVSIEHIIGAFGIGDRNKKGERDFCIRNNYAVMNTFFMHRPSHKWAWYRWSKKAGMYTEKSMIDLVLTNDKRIINDVKTLPSVCLDSDHRLVLVKVHLQKPKELPSTKKKRLKIERLKHISVQRK
uniref:Endonuclease/exonuclease/phosphatase domain-containing protein n=1 Tax=Latimeria chalumnae TaxID=7897 RepID=H3A352_LATCH